MQWSFLCAHYEIYQSEIDKFPYPCNEIAMRVLARYRGITTGGGGAILTNDLKLAQHAKHLTSTAKLPHRWDYRHDEVGYNYRMPNLNAALGCAQLEQLPDFLSSKRALFLRYQQAGAFPRHA